jgi:Leucine-rich repeat (LRR) protein
VNCLRLDGCDNIEDISALGNVHTLGLSNSLSVMSVSALRNVSDLDLTGFRGNDLSGLKSVVTLDICQASSVTNITMLKTLKKLVINHRNNITDFRGLASLKALHTYDIPEDDEDDNDEEDEQHNPCPFLIAQGVETFSQLVDLNMYGCVFESEQQLQSENGSPVQLHFSHLRNLRTLSLQECVFSNFPKDFPVLQALTLVDCAELISLTDLPGYLETEDCKKLKKLSINGNNKFPVYKVKVRECQELTGVQVSRRISKLSIVACDKFKDLEVYSQVGRLRISFCSQFKVVRGFAPIVSMDIS